MHNHNTLHSDWDSIVLLPYNEIEKTVLGTIKIAPDAMNAAEVIDLCAELAEIGVQ